MSVCSVVGDPLPDPQVGSDQVGWSSSSVVVVSRDRLPQFSRETPSGSIRLSHREIPGRDKRVSSFVSSCPYSDRLGVVQRRALLSREPGSVSQGSFGVTSPQSLASAEPVFYNNNNNDNNYSSTK